MRDEPQREAERRIGIADLHPAVAEESLAIEGESAAVGILERHRIGIVALQGVDHRVALEGEDVDERRGRRPEHPGAESEMDREEKRQLPSRRFLTRSEQSERQE